MSRSGRQCGVRKKKWMKKSRYFSRFILLVENFMRPHLCCFEWSHGTLPKGKAGGGISNVMSIRWAVSSSEHKAYEKEERYSETTRKLSNSVYVGAPYSFDAANGISTLFSGDSRV